MSAGSLSTGVLMDDPLFGDVKEWVVDSTGMAYYRDRDDDFGQRIGRRLSTLGVQNCAAYLGILQDTDHGPAELDELAAEVTIGETYFLRHPELFDALRDLVLPDLIARRKAGRRLKIWSAGCADGPEAYSFAILLRREMAHQLAGWDVTILGTDINRDCLARAREGNFEEWALRSTPEEVRRSCLDILGEQP